MAKGVFVISEQSEGKFRKVTYEVISEGRRIADKLGAELTVALLGQNTESLTPELGQYGADKVLVVEDPGLHDFIPEKYADVLEPLIQNSDPVLILAGATAQGKDLMPRLAAMLDAGLVMDCIGISIKNDKLTFTRSIYGGKVLSSVVVKGCPKIVAVRPNVMVIRKNPRLGAVIKQNFKISPPRTAILEKHLQNPDKVDLAEADIVVSGGYGTQGDFGAIEDLAKILNCAVGASRSVVDEGWRPHSDQVGQTGKTVSPLVYIACGVSGAIQHMAGISGSKFIVAINKDPDAPIYAKSDFGIVDDLFEVVPAIIAEIKKTKL